MEAKKLEELHRAHVSRLQADTARALQRHGFDALVIHSGTPLKWMQPDDNYWPLRTMPEFRHWAPLTEAGCAVVVEPGRKPRLLRPMERSFWEAPAAPESDHFWSAFDVVEGASAASMRDLMPKGRVAFFGDEVATAAACGMEAVNPREL